MRIGVLNPSYEDSHSAFREHDPLCDPAPYAPEHEWRRFLIRKATAGAQVRDLARSGCDVFVNLCDGAWDEDRPGIDVVYALERMGLAFTGATSAFYEPTRETMKRVCRYAGLDTPNEVFVRDAGDLARAIDTLRFPMIVKHENSYGSIGMTRDARVATPDALVREATRMIEAFGGALVEEFVEGREFTVLVSEDADAPDRPRTWAPVECRFPPGETFKHFDLKWVDYDGLTWVPVDDPALDARLRDAAARLFTGLSGTGYGRCDVRLGEDGALHVLEINPNCGIFYPKGAFGSADVILGWEPDGHRAFLEQIVAAALARQRRARRSWGLRFVPGRGYGTVATADIAAGDVVQRYEEALHPLVTRGHVERTWDERRRRWFREYAWPLTDEVFVMWHDDPAQWRPIDHSCDPNTWLSGLDLVARRAIRRGEALTIDYATFCGDTMAAFECRCGAAECRGVIRGTDHLLPFVDRYGEHVSDWVRRRRAGRFPPG